MSTFRRIHWSTLSIAPASQLQPPFFCFWPEPIDHDQCFELAGFNGFEDSDSAWDGDLNQLVEDLFACLRQFGDPRLVTGALPLSANLRKREGSLVDAVICAATDDQFQPCVIGFGDPMRAAVAVSDGHPIFWIGGAISAKSVLESVSRGRECVLTTLNWSRLIVAGDGPSGTLHLKRST